MWGGISQLEDNSPYEVRRKYAFPHRYKERELSDREKMLVAKVKEGVINDKMGGVRVPNIKVLDDFKCPKKERRIVMDEVYVRLCTVNSLHNCKIENVNLVQVEGRKAKDKRCVRLSEPYDPNKPKPKKKPQYSYLDLVRCNGRTSQLAATKRKQKAKKKKTESYAEARKRRADFRRKLVEVIMHRDGNDDSEEEPAHPGAPLTTKEKDLLRYVRKPYCRIGSRFHRSGFAL